MRTFMFNSATKIRESSIAMFAGVWFLTGVRSHVSIQFEINHKSFAANGAHERFLVSMSSHMTANDNDGISE